MGDTSPDDPKRRKAFGRNPTSKYQGGSAGWFGFQSAELDGAPTFTWLDVPRMRRDPHVRFLERMWRAPFQKVKWRVKAEDPRVAKFVNATLRRFWRRSLPKILSRYWRYGCAPGGAEFVTHRGQWRLDRVRAIEPQDAAPRVWAGPRAGQADELTLSNGSALAPDVSPVWVGPPHAMWFAALPTPWQGCSARCWSGNRGTGAAGAEVHDRRGEVQGAARRVAEALLPSGCLSCIPTVLNPRQPDAARCWAAPARSDGRFRCRRVRS